MSAMLSRRAFLKTGSTAATGLVIGFYLPRRSAAAAGSVIEAPPPVLSPNAWLRIDAKGQVTVLVEKSELGQGVFTSIPMILAEELEVEWSAIHVEQAPTQPDVYHDLITGGSGSIWESWTPLREAAAKARELFVQAAAHKWRVRPEACRAAKGSVIHQPTGRRLSYGQLVETVTQSRTQSRLSTDGARLKHRKDYRIIGRSIPRTDVPSKVDGTAMFGLDVTVPGMLYAVIARCPTFGGKVASFDGAAARAVPGVREVIQIEPLPRLQNTAGGVAVVADSTWAAIRGRNALKVSWKDEQNNESSATLRQLAEAQSLGAATVVAREEGDARAALAGAAKRIEAVYELPFEAHATMEPMNCTAHVREEDCEMWVGTQWPNVIRDELVRLSGLRWTVHNTFSGGAFGRRGQWDYPAEAWQISRAVKAPVKLVWTREDDMQHDFYRPFSCHRMAGGLVQGKPTAWTHRIVSTPIREFFDSAERLKDPRRVAFQEMGGAADVPYAIPHLRVDFAPLKSRVPRAWWRSVAHSFNAFAVESFVDELAVAAGKDPYRFRLELLREDRNVQNPMRSNPPCDTRRLRGVLQLAALKAPWDKPPTKGRGRGIACHYSFETYVAQVAEVSIQEDGNVRVHRVVAAVDCGTVVNPDGVRAQMEGAIIFGLSAALKGQITIQDGAVQQSNFHDYPVLRLEEAPVIEVHLVPSTERPSGMGEPGVPPIAPAVANALFAATGKRLRKLPLLAG